MIDKDIRRWMTLCESEAELDLADRIIVYHNDQIVYHTTNADAATKIHQQGFRSGKEIGSNEKRGAVFFADIDVNPGIYARNYNKLEPYYGQETKHIAVNLKGLRLLNMTEKWRSNSPNRKYLDADEFPLHKTYQRFITRGELQQIPLFAKGLIDGTISYLNDGLIYEVCLPSNVANNARISSDD